jgi:hypothetical protein
MSSLIPGRAFATASAWLILMKSLSQCAFLPAWFKNLFKKRSEQSFESKSLLAFSVLFGNGFLFIVGEIQLVLCRFLVMNVTGIAAFCLINLIEKNKSAALRYMEDSTRRADFVGIKGILFAKFDLV